MAWKYLLGSWKSGRVPWLGHPPYRRKGWKRELSDPVRSKVRKYEPKGPDCNYFRLADCMISVTVFQFSCCSMKAATVNKWAWLYSNRFLFTKSRWQSRFGPCGMVCLPLDWNIEIGEQVRMGGVRSTAKSRKKVTATSLCLCFSILRELKLLVWLLLLCNFTET